MPLSTSTASPESSASAGSPVAAAGPGLEQRVALEGALGLGRFRVVRDGGQPENPDVRRGAADDPAELGELWRCGWPAPPGGGYAPAWSRAKGRLLQLGQLCAAGGAEVEQCVQHRAVERRLSAVPCTSMNSPAPLITMFMSVSAPESSV